MNKTTNPSIKQVKQTWDQFSQFYVKQLEEGSTQTTIQFLEHLTCKYNSAHGKYKLPANSSVMEIGCGSGLFAKFLLTQNPGRIRDLHLIDLSTQMIDACRQRMSALVEGPFSEFELSDLDFENPANKIIIKEQNAEDLSQYPNDYFDLVFVNFVIHLTESPEQMAKEVKRVLRPNGVAVFSVLGDYKASSFFHVYTDLFEQFGKMDQKSLYKFHLGTENRLRGLCQGFDILGLERVDEDIPISKMMAEVLSANLRI